MSPEKLLLPKRPTGLRLAAGDLEAFIQREVDAGYARGRAEALAGAAALVEEAAARVDQAREDALLAVPGFAARFAEEIARQLLHIELSTGRHAIETMVRETLAQSGVGRGECVVHVNPKDAERLEGVVWRRGTALEADPNVPLGSVQVTTTSGLLVRDVDLCVKQAAERLHAHLRSASAEPAPQAADTPADAEE